MHISDNNNVLLAADQATVDQINSRFYSRFNYPWYPRDFPYWEDNDYWRRFLCQDIGDWSLTRLPQRMKIWVAGCGTNQAIFTALKYPDAEVTGTDVSPKSIEVCRNTARQLGIDNLVLEEHSLNSNRYQEAFDYIICTGVIHHNANPATTLQALSRALRKNGVMELMVYNFYHRIITTAFQKAVHIIGGLGKVMNAEEEYAFTRQLMHEFPVDNLVRDYLGSLDKQEESLIADALIQPVEHSFTVESLDKMVQDCGLDMLQHCVNQFDVAEDRLSWNLPITHTSYQNLADTDRWQVGNLLMLEKSPMLWFYLQRKDADHPRQSEREICESFLQTTFQRAGTCKYRFLLTGPGVYENIAEPQAFPAPERPVHKNALKVFSALEPHLTMQAVIEKAGLDLSFPTVNALRIGLSTSAFPYMTSGD